MDHVDRLRKRLSTLKQTTSVTKYIDHFRDIVVELGNDKPDDQSTLFQFINGLKPTVWLQVRLAQPPDIITAEIMVEQADSALYLSSGHQPRFQPRNNRQQDDRMELGAMQVVSGFKSGAGMNRNKQHPRSIICHRCGKQGHTRKNRKVKLPGQPNNQRP